jgi:hypothetical protein
MDDRRRNGTAVATTKTDPQEPLVDTIKAAVAEAVAKKEEQEAEEARARPGRKSSTTAFLTVILLAFIASGLYAFFEIRAMSIPLDEELGVEDDAVGVHLYSIGVRLDRYNRENGHYPASLDLVGVPADQSLEYTLARDNQYQMKYTSNGIIRIYRSQYPLTSLLSKGSNLEN